MNCKGQIRGHNYIQGSCLDCSGRQAVATPKKSRKDKEYEKENKELKKHKIDYSFQELGITISQYFPKNQHKWMWSMFYKYSENQIRQAFKVCQEKKIYNIAYLKGVLKNL